MSISTQASALQFLEFIQNHIDPTLCKRASEDTKDQSSTPLWHSLRYGRITASILYESGKATMANESLKLKILGAAKVPLTDALKRGKLIEDLVRQEASKQLKIPFATAGFNVCAKWPHFGGSPDGISEDYVLEIKCPSKESTIEKYFKNGAITAKTRAQLQFQMYLYRKAQGILAVADPQFEENKKIRFVLDNYDYEFISSLAENADNYWAEKIFPLLIS